MKKNLVYIAAAAAFAGILCGYNAAAQGQPGPGPAGHGLPRVNATVCDTTRSENTLRLLYWNIQNGMWADQQNNYDTFVEWVKSFDPDICVWCEASTIFYEGSTKAKPESERYLPDGWAELAARYGHPYVALGGWRDNYPQVVTSKYPIETVLKITDGETGQEPIWHGAAIQTVKAEGGDIWFVTLHTWPFGYGPQAAKEDRDASSKAFDGEKYREYEIDYICRHTVNDPQYASQQNWLMLGDFNSISQLDNWHYRLPENSPAFLTQRYIHDHTDLIDVIANRFPGQFVASIQSGRRIDYIHASRPMYDRIVKAMTVTDDWTFGVKAEGLSNFWYPSDHFPLLVDFRK